MDKNKGSPEKSASDQDLRREMPPPPPPPSPEGSESENLRAGGQGNRPPVMSTDGVVTAPVPLAPPPTPRPRPTRYRLVPARDNSRRVVVREPWINSGGEFFSCAISAALTITPPENKRKGQYRELPNRQPRCAACGKTFESWKPLFVSTTQIGEGSGAGKSSERSSEAPSADLNDGLELNLNPPPPPPESDSEDENPKRE